MKESQKTKIIITGAEHPTGLGMARALAGKNYEITGIASGHTPCCRSRYWDHLHYIDRYDDFVISLLEKIGKKNNSKSVLYAASDTVVKMISDHRSRLQPYYLFSLPEKEIVECFLDKASFHKWAVENRFRVPVSQICSSYAELEKCLKSVPFPVIIKPFEKNTNWNAVSPIHKAFYLENRDQLKAIPFDLFAVSANILVQQYIPGGDQNVYFCLAYYNRVGKKIADYTGRKLYQWPPLSGSTAAAVGEDNPEVRRFSHEIFTRANFVGLGSMEFKKSSQDGKYYIIEPTIGRNDLQSGVSVAGGINLPVLSLFELLEIPYPIVKSKKAVWVHEEGLADALRVYYREGSLNASEIIDMVSPRTSFAFFQLFDPLPAIEALKAMAKNKMRRKNHG